MIVAGRRVTGAVLRPMIPTTSQIRAKNFDEEDIIAYIAPRSGEYDEIERVIVYDPYADGWRMYDENKPIEATDEPPSHMKHSIRQTSGRLRRKGWMDAQEYAERKAANSGKK